MVVGCSRSAGPNRRPSDTRGPRDRVKRKSTWRSGSDLRCSGGHDRTELERHVMMHTEIAFANERAIIADMLINLLTNIRLTYLPDLEPADAHELLLAGA